MRTVFLRAVALAPFALPFSHSPVNAAEQRDEIFVTDERRGALADALAFADAQPGNVDVTPLEAYENRYAVSLRDALAFSPGVVMQPNFGEDGRLSIRGSGLAQNFHLRGVELLFNGVPLNAADGFGDFQEIDLLFTSHLTTARGANAFRTGGATLGGAVEIGGASAESVSERLFLRSEGGSFGTSRLGARAAQDFGRVDALVAGTWQRQDGFRDHARQNNERLYANAGIDWSDAVETRFGVLVTDIDQEISGAVSLDEALNHPRAANPASVSGDHQRDMQTRRVFMTTRAEASAGTFTLGGSYAHKKLRHPIPVFIAQESDDLTLFTSYEGARVFTGLPLSWTLGARYRDTGLDSAVFVNLSGDPGPQIGDARQNSSSVEVYGELRAEIVPRLEAIVGVNWLRTVRDFDDRLNDGEDDRLVFRQTNPRFGLLWRAREGLQFFANASASYEPPTFIDLTQGGVAGFTPIAAQDGFTYEAGLRGAAGRLNLEAAVYHARLDGEFVAFASDPLIPAPIFNADDTIHRGVEFYARLALVEDWNGLSISPRIAYAYNDFRFDGDRVFADNRLAGVAAHVGRAEVAFAKGAFTVAPQITFQAGDNFVDYANTLEAPGYALVGVEASARLATGAHLFIEARNLADKGYALNYSTIADAGLAANLNLFTPGEGRSVFAGLRIGFGGAP